MNSIITRMGTMRVGGVFTLTCIGRDGRVKWRDYAKNLVTNEGLQHILDVLFTGATQSSTWYVGLQDSDPETTAASTLAAPGGFTEFTEYDNDRKEFVDVRSAQTVTNSASSASFSINTAGSGVGGAFLCDAATGTTAILLCGAALAGSNRTVADGDTVNCDYNFSAADDGA